MSAITSGSTASGRRSPLSASRPSAMYSALAGITSETMLAEVPFFFITRWSAAGAV